MLSLAEILMVFYLYLLVRWQYVRRSWLYLIGAAGLALTILFENLAGISASSAWVAISGILRAIGTIVAFAGGIGACFGAALPMFGGMKIGEDTTPKT